MIPLHQGLVGLSETDNRAYLTEVHLSETDAPRIVVRRSHPDGTRSLWARKGTGGVHVIINHVLYIH
jgi:hypothetical protein